MIFSSLSLEHNFSLVGLKYSLKFMATKSFTSSSIKIFKQSFKQSSRFLNSSPEVINNSKINQLRTICSEYKIMNLLFVDFIVSHL